jgi:hypothetical protein
LNQVAYERNYGRNSFCFKKLMFADITRLLLKVVCGYTHEMKWAEHTIKFAVENWWISDHESLISGKPAKSYIDAIDIPKCFNEK